MAEFRPRRGGRVVGRFSAPGVEARRRAVGRL